MRARNRSALSGQGPEQPPKGEEPRGATRKRPALRLRTRITFYFVGLLVLWSILVVAALEQVLTHTFRRIYREGGAEIARAFLVECVPLAYYEDIAGIAAILKREMKTHPALRYIAVLDATEQPIWSTFPAGVPKDLLSLSHRPSPTPGVSVRLIRAGGDLIYDYEARDAVIRLRVGLSLAPMLGTIGQTTSSVLWIGAAGLLAVFGLALYVSRPVETLSRAIERAVLLDRDTAGRGPPSGTVETTAIAERFQDLMNRLQERTRQLDASKKLAYLGEISAGIAHEVNNPLGIIVMNSDFLTRRARSGELPRAAAVEAERLNAAARRATLAVRKLLQFARYSRSGQKPVLRPAQIESLIRENLDLLAERIRSSGCAVRTDIPAGLPSIRCDGEGIQQVLLNLLTNALDASRAGGDISIRVSLDGELLSLRVIDNGEGMTAEVLQRAMEPFFTTKELGRGTGLGLSISESIVRAHGGEIFLESRPGGGTVATVRLPIGQAG